MMNMNGKKIAMVVAPLIIALLSIFVVTRFAASPEFHAKTIQSLDDKRTTVMELAAASAATSAAITLIPGDTATPIAEKLADMSSYFLIVICAIYLEKYLLTITGYAAFMFLIPIACALYSANVFLQKDLWKNIIRKLIFFGFAIVLVVPASVKLSDLIEETYNSSIQTTIDQAKDTTDEIKENAEDEGFLEGFWNKITDGVSSIAAKVENSLNNFIEAIAVMIVTSCLIPILVLFFFIWLVKIVLGLNVELPRKKV
ncbi:MAG: hypothetical protein PHS82_05385 [Lachnospiraceae bacterium]|nr:hypothetical protein [Lachnospiraceae bacterium]